MHENPVSIGWPGFIVTCDFQQDRIQNSENKKTRKQENKKTRKQERIQLYIWIAFNAIVKAIPSFNFIMDAWWECPSIQGIFPRWLFSVPHLSLLASSNALFFWGEISHWYLLGTVNAWQLFSPARVKKTVQNERIFRKDKRKYGGGGWGVTIHVRDAVSGFGAWRVLTKASRNTRKSCEGNGEFCVKRVMLAFFWVVPTREDLINYLIWPPYRLFSPPFCLKTNLLIESLSTWFGRF